MYKGLLGKVGFVSVILSAIALTLIFVLPVFSMPFTPSVSPNNTAASATNQLLNFTIVNINATRNITQVNITLPAGFGFIAVSNTTTASSTIFSNASQIVFWTNATEEGFVASGGGQQYFSINVSVPNVSSVAYNFNVSILDTDGTYDSTNVTVTVNDTTYPTWSGQLNYTPPSYSPTTLSQFNITWSDNVDISTVLIEGNWSNSNISMTNETYGGGIYNYSTILPAGVWQWRSIANDTKGNVNASSPVIIIYIAQATPSMTLTNATVTYPTSTTVNGSVVTGDPAGKYNISLYRNDSLKNSSATASFTYETNTLGAGLWNYTLVYNGTQNYTSNSATNFTIVSPNSSNPVRLVIDNSTDAYNDQNVIITYGTSITANCSNVYPNSGSCSLYRNSSPVANITNETITLGGGIHNYTVTTDGNSNYLANTSGESFNVTVNRAPTSINLSINGTQANWTSTYPNSTLNVTAVINVTGLTVSIMWNGTVICSGTTNCSSMVQYGGGYHNFTANYSVSNNYFASSASWNATISQGATNVTLYLNGTIANITSIYPNSTINVTAVANVTGANVTISRNGTLIQNTTSTATDVRSWGAYLNNFTAQTLSNANYSASSVVFLWFNVSKGTPTGSISGINVTLPSTTSITPSESNAGDAEVNYSFWRDTSLVSLANGTTSISAATTPSTAGTYTYMLNSTAGENWTANSSISTLVITVGAAPSTTTTGGSSTGGISTTGMITYINLAVGKANITANYLTTSGKLIANIARYQDVAIRGMNITVVNNVANIKIMTFKLATLPSSVPYDINGKVYNYINVDKANFTDADIKSVNISFAVNKTWLTNNNVDTSNITLYRWANNKWNDLNAVKVSDDGKEVFFIVSSPGLSVFIIGTKGGAPAVTETPTVCTESWQCTDWSTCTNSEQTRTCTDANNCGTTTSKPSESQSCTVSKGETTVEAPVATSILTTVIVIVIAIIACVFIFLQRTKISSYLVTITKKSNNRKKTSYLESLARKFNKVEEEEEEKLNVRTD